MGCWGRGAQSPSLPSVPPSGLLSSSSSREERAGVASWAGVRLCSFSPEGAGFPCAGLGEEVINDRRARRGECSGLMLVLIRSWSPATDRIQPGPCVCVCWEVGGNGGPGTPGPVPADEAPVARGWRLGLPWTLPTLGLGVWAALGPRLGSANSAADPV